MVVDQRNLFVLANFCAAAADAMAFTLMRTPIRPSSRRPRISPARS
ncbi:hypothetical protein [Paracoccus binzhouensis]|nr:hypothetical protein [Paracoccus binzhouensis]